MNAAQEDVEGMASSAVEFLLKNIESLKLFIKKMNEDFGQRDFIFVLKMFVLNQNKVFDMTSYMKRQSEMAEEYVKEYRKDIEPEERRKMLSKWVEENAALYRKRAIFKQMDCIEEMSAQIVPLIKKAIRE
jgi:NAD+--asparagine ADP-ribosyltransferase